MGEYVKYKNDKIKIGTCENLYYATYDKYLDALKKGELSLVDGNDYPVNYAKPNSGYRFRFPFPDEDKLSLRDISILDDFHRGVPVKIDPSLIQDDSIPDGTTQMEIVQQKLIHRQEDGKLCLALVWRVPGGETFRVENDEDMKSILKSIIKNHITDNADPANKLFYRKIAQRIIKGYRIDAPEVKIKQEPKVQNGIQDKTSINNQKRRGIS